MIVVNFIVGLLIVATIIGTLYGIGLFTLERSGDYDRDTNLIEILFHGFLGLMLVGVCIMLLLTIYKLGESVVNELFK